MLADVDETALIAQQFLGPAAEEFPTSPLYRSLRPVVADQQAALEMLTHRRAGQQAPYLFFAAVHYLLLQGAEHPLRSFFSSVVDEAQPPAGARGAFVDFCHVYRQEIEHQVRTRLVQTNAVRRVVGLRFALAVIGRACREPVHLIEVGASAGLLLQVDRYRYRIGDHLYGRLDAPVTIGSRWIGGPTPDLDTAVPIASRIGVDLNPVDVTDPDQRQWLRALVWPENLADAELLHAALTWAAVEPQQILAGDAIDVLPQLRARLPTGETRVVFHAATRMHVPSQRRAAFDQAIDAIGDSGPLYHVWHEPNTAPHHLDAPEDPPAIRWHRPGSTRCSPLVQIAGHGQWFAPLTTLTPGPPGV